VKHKKTQRRSPKRPRPVNKQRKRQYRIRNWPEYNQALKQRGSLTLWLDVHALRGWTQPSKSGRRGASRRYSDEAISCALTLQSVYHLPLRATQGLLDSLLELLGVPLPVPDFSTLSRRRKTLAVNLSQRLHQPQHLSQNQSVHLVVDATGFKVYGEGEWKVRQHGWSQRRTWRKLHLGFNEASGEVLAAAVTTNAKSDKEMLAPLLAQVPAPIRQVSGDGGYDAAVCYGAIAKRGARATIAPRSNARLHERDGRWQERNQNLQRIRELQGRRRKDPDWGRRQWQQESGYHRRSLAETGVFRLKTIFGDRLRARTLAGQSSELLLRCAALNKMALCGMPQSYAL